MTDYHLFFPDGYVVGRSEIAAKEATCLVCEKKIYSGDGITWIHWDGDKRRETSRTHSWHHEKSILTPAQSAAPTVARVVTKGTGAHAVELNGQQVYFTSRKDFAMGVVEYLNEQNANND